jgi:hypothetical protein
MLQTHELLQAAVPTRLEKRRIADQLGRLNESTVYKWCEDKANGSGSRNFIDVAEVVLEHAAVHHPDAALAIVRHLESVVTTILVARAEALPAGDLVAVLQPQSEKELTEATQAFSRALRQLVLSGDCDLNALLREVQDAAVTIRKAEVMIQAVLTDQPGGTRGEA